MCKPGSASCGSSRTAGGVGLALAVLAAAGVASTAAAFVSNILTAILVTMFSIAAALSMLLVVILRRTRGVVTWPMRPSLASRSRPVTVPARVLPVRREARPVAGAVARPAVPAHQPLAIEAPAPVPVRIGVPGGSSGLAAAWPEARVPEMVPAREYERLRTTRA
jgi:hypothetical protein